MALDVPVYHLDGVVQNRSERESFDGPLDLILLLLSKNKMEISDIQIALILDQYLAWMNQRQTLDLEVASEFVAMAAHLVYIKTRMLLSLQDEEVTSEVEALIASLEARQRSASYSKIQAVLPSLQHRYAVGKDYLPKPPEPLLPAAEYTYQHLPTDLPQALNKLLLKRSAETLPPLSAQLEGIVAREPYPVEEKASEILRSLTCSGTTVFFRSVSGQPEPFRGGGHLSGGAGAVPRAEDRGHRPGSGLHGDLGRRGGGNWMTMEFQDIKSTIEGILFASGEPVPLARLCQVLEQDKNTVESILHALADEYAFQRRGMRILQLGDRYQMCSAPEYADLIRQALDLRKPPQLSLAALESLAIIAYFQPATKGVVEQIRGVDSSYTVNLLVERGLIQEAGRLNAPGRPVLFRTTDHFLRCFGLKTLDDLPPLPEREGERALAQELEDALKRREQEEG